MVANIEIKRAKGFFGNTPYKVNTDVFDDLGMDDGGLLALTLARKNKNQKF